jgi:DNA-binding response OmpR family regulator
LDGNGVTASWTIGDKTVNPRVLVVEDEANIRELVCLHLGVEGYACESVADGQDALRRTEAERFDLLVVDVMLPKLDGVSLTRAVRRGRVNHDVPILMLTARREESEKVLGLESGADDYLTKPFGVRELVARARALLRRPRVSPQVQPANGASVANPASAGLRVNGDDLGGPIVVHGVEVDPARRRVRIEGRDIELTDQEFRLLYLLASHAGIVFGREALLAKVWRGDTFVTVRSVDTLVKRLRRRIEADPAEPRYLLTVWGVGYKFADV